MKLATTTEDFERFGLEEHDSICAIREAGFRCVDLSMYSSKYFMGDDWKEKAERLKALAEKIGVQFVQSHSPAGNGLLKDEHWEKFMFETRRSIDVCGFFEIPNLVVHAGTIPTHEKEEYYEKNKEFYQTLFPTAEKNNVNLLVENSWEGEYYYFTTGADMKEFIKYADHPLLHACWDTGHANIEGHQYEDILALGSDLYGLHINDNYGTNDHHVIPFLGTMSVDEVMCGLLDSGYEGYFTFEACNAFKPSNHWAGGRRKFERDTRMKDATLSMQKKLEEVMYEVGKGILSAYGVYEE